MDIIIATTLIFLEIFTYIIFIDVIFSWLSLVGLKRPRFIADLIDPVYAFIRKYIPTSIGGLDFAPIILFLIISFLRGLILGYS